MWHLLGRAEVLLPAIDPGSGGVIVPLWLAALIAALLFAFGLGGFVQQWARAGLVLVALAAAWIIVAPESADRAAQRRSLDARLNEIVTRASAPGSALACLDGTAGEIVEAACEKALFATPQAAAAAVSYVSAQLSLLAQASDYERRSATSYQPSLAGVRLAVETDRFGIAAHVLAAREGCTAEHCDFLARLQAPSQVSENLESQKYELVVAQHATEWLQNGLTAAPAAANTAPAAVASAAPAKPNNLFFPSSASIPAVSIMAPEPTGPAAAGAAEPASKQPPAPARKPAAAAAPARRPPAGNAAAAGTAAPAASPTAPATPNASGHPTPGQPSDN